MSEIREMPYADGPLTLDLLLPDHPDGRVLFFVHGGGWRTGSPAMWRPWMEIFCARGCVCAAPRYRLLPDHPFPAAVADVRLAMAWVKTQAPAWGGRSEPGGGHRLFRRRAARGHADDHRSRG